jgi:hypothetical protein
VKQAIVDAIELDARLVMWSLRITERVLHNAGVTRLIEIEGEKVSAGTIDDIHAQVAGVFPQIMLEGDVGAGALGLRHGRGPDPWHSEGQDANRPDHRASRADSVSATE